MKIELTKQELTIIILGITSGSYPIHLQKQAFELAIKLRDLSRQMQ